MINKSEKRRRTSAFWLYVLLFGIISNGYIIIKSNISVLWVMIPVFLYITLFAGIPTLRTKKLTLAVCCHGAVALTVFLASLGLTIAYHIVLLIMLVGGSLMPWVWSALTSFGAHFLLFWVGIICVYLTSFQLGVKQRVVGALCGMIPVANLFTLRSIIRTTMREVAFEAEKEKVNRARKADKVCQTKYPVLFVHGVFFRDTKYFNYWGRIPRELTDNGATVYYGNHQSALSVADSAAELAHRIKQIVEETGCEKVNVIAHSKGGLDCRYALANLGVAPLVASLTTVNTPHRGCKFADYLLEKLPKDMVNGVAETYNKALKKLGDENPDFIAAVSDLTASSCKRLNDELADPAGVYCQSVGSTMEKARGGKFPLNFSYNLVKLFDGKNDGLVSEDSFSWGERYILNTNGKKRGISHGDMIDLNRENIEGFDVREFYVGLVGELKTMGL